MSSALRQELFFLPVQTWRRENSSSTPALYFWNVTVRRLALLEITIALKNLRPLSRLL